MSHSDDIKFNTHQQQFEQSSLYSQKEFDCGFVGLSNQGVTCYMNSLIQCLYMRAQNLEILGGSIVFFLF